MPKRRLNGSADMAFAQQLRKARIKSGLTQQQVADTVNINRTTYAKYELGRSKPGITLIRAFVKLYNTDYNKLFSEE